VCAQLQIDSEATPMNGVDPVFTALGIDPAGTQLALQTDVVKELVNKLAWVLGSTYRKPYTSMRMPARAYAWKIVKAILRDHGYPEKIRKE